LPDTLSDLGAEHPVDDSLTGSSLARPVSFKLETRHGEVQVLNRMPAIPPYARLRAAAVPVELGDGTIATVCSLAQPRDAQDARLSPPAGAPDPHLT
jgi:hypothetical protein